MSLGTNYDGSVGVELAMSQGSRFGRLLALVTLGGGVVFAGLVGCAPLPMGSESKSSSVLGERLSPSAQNAPLPATASASASNKNAPMPTTASGSQSTMAPSQTAAPSRKVASAAAD